MERIWCEHTKNLIHTNTPQASEASRAALSDAQAAQAAAEERCAALEGELCAARSRLGLLQAEAGRLSEQLAAAQVCVHRFSFCWLR